MSRTKNKSKVPDRWVRLQIGERPDSVVAREAGVSRERVRQIRVLMRIPLNRKARSEYLSKSARDRYAKQNADRDERIRNTFQTTGSVAGAARKVGVSKETVRAVLARSGVRLFGHRSTVDWSQVNWLKPTSELAKNLGVHPTTVSRQRFLAEARGKDVLRDPQATGAIGRGRKNAERLAKDVDWSRSNRDLARDLKKSPETISTLRRRLRLLGHTVPSGRRT